MSVASCSCSAIRKKARTLGSARLQTSTGHLHCSQVQVKISEVEGTNIKPWCTRKNLRFQILFNFRVFVSMKQSLNS